MVADMSSDIFSRPIDVSKYICIYGGAQDIYTILLSIDVKYGIKVEIEIEPEILMIKQKINAIKMNIYKLQQ
jgi:hypothetical protein